jgi:hypothetical protein
MPHLFSGLNQKQQSGKITNGTVIAGSKGRGSIVRMVSHCKTNSENSSDCINEVITNTIPPRVNSATGLLFDKSSFYNLFDVNGSGRGPILRPIDTNKYKKLPGPIITALNVGADRWANFLSFAPDMVNLIRSFSSQLVGGSLKNWKGIMLGSFTIKEPEPPTIIADTYPPDPLATCDAEYIDGLQTTMNYSFTLNINKNWFDYDNLQGVSQEYLNSVITHELGHALGMPSFKSTVNGEQDSQELLPNIYKGALSNYDSNPDAYSKNYFPKALLTFNTIGGWVNMSHANTLPNELIPLDKDGNHFRANTIYKLEDNGSTNFDIFYRGFFNEIMNPHIEDNKQYYISQISINILRDLYTFWKGRKYYNYFYKGGNETNGYTYRDISDLIEFF